MRYVAGAAAAADVVVPVARVYCFGGANRKVGFPSGNQLLPAPCGLITGGVM